MRVWHREAAYAGLYEAAICRAIDSIDSMENVPTCMLDDNAGSCLIIVAMPSDAYFDAQQLATLPRVPEHTA